MTLIENTYTVHTDTDRRRYKYINRQAQSDSLTDKHGDSLVYGQR